MSTFVPGMKVRYLPQPEWGVGHLIGLTELGDRASVLFPERSEPTIVSTKGGALVPAPLSVGDAITNAKGRPGKLTEEVEGGRGLRRYVLRYDDGEEDELPESELRALPPKPDLLSLLREGRVGDAKNFLLRRQALVLDDERRCDALGALLASRVMVKPHQVGVVQRVLSARRPRFVLADEVGLGKTIEAGMIFSALRLSGLASRVLVVAPSHLTVQWLGELFHKFNQLFTLMDTDRFEASLKEQPDKSPWERFDKVVTSLELLSRSEEHRQLVASPDAYWDLVIIDEAHHLKGPRAFEAASALAENSWGLLLLTATPMQLDPEEYRSLLTLIDPQTAPTSEGFKARLARQEQISTAVRGLLEGKNPAAAVKALAAQFPDDPKLKAGGDRDELLAPPRRDVLALRSAHPQPARGGRRLLRPAAAPARGGGPRGRARGAHHRARAGRRRPPSCAAPRSRTCSAGSSRRRPRSSPGSRVRRGSQSLRSELRLPTRDAKFLAFLEVLKSIWKAEPGAKVLVFTEARETLELLQSELRKENVEALGYHGDLPLVERDRQVARFRDPEGPKLLICTEVGGEGRNFQFAHHLVNYDLPWSPATMEQRIGRLDRIGQQHPVEIHVFDAKGTLSADVLALLADAVGVFGETVGGLDAVLEEVEGKLTELALLGAKDRAKYAKELSEKVQAARESVKRAYDPLLDLRSFDKAGVEALIARAQARMNIEAEEDEGVEEGLWSVARDLDERLEETVTELARKVGIGVDTDEQVEAFQCAFHFGHALNVEALPGVNLQEERTVLGSFWRDTAVELEEIEYFATGHPIVEALFGFLKDGPYGRNGMRFCEKRGPLKAKGLEFLFHVVPPEPEDTSAGARVPSRQLSRFLDKLLLHVAVAEGPDGSAKVDASLLPVLTAVEGQSLKGDQIRAAFPTLPRFVDLAVAAAQKAADADLAKIVQRAKKAIEKERDDALARAKLALGHQGVPDAEIAAQLREESEHYGDLLGALSGLKVTLDSASGFLINR